MDDPSLEYGEENLLLFHGAAKVEVSHMHLSTARTTTAIWSTSAASAASIASSAICTTFILGRVGGDGWRWCSPGAEEPRTSRCAIALFRAIGARVEHCHIAGGGDYGIYIGQGLFTNTLTISSVIQLQRLRPWEWSCSYHARRSRW